MTSYGDVRKIIDDALRLGRALKQVGNAPREMEEMLSETNRLANLMEGMRKNWDKIEEDIKLQETLTQVRLGIAQLQSFLEQSSDRRRDIWKRIWWPAKKSLAEKEMEKIRQLNSHLSQMTTHLSFSALLDEKERNIVHDFIEAWTPAMSPMLFDVSKRITVTGGTGAWFQEVEQYQVWKMSKNGLLWVNGIQGCGKTGLMISLTEHLRLEAQNSSSLRVATVFCYHQTTGMQILTDPMEIVMSFWVQLVRTWPDCLPDIDFMNGRADMQLFRGKERVEQQMRLLEKAVSQAGNTVLILDGLDEIPQELQVKVVRQLREIQRATRCCRVLVTSRPYESIIRIFRGLPQFDMTAQDLDFDLELYMRERFMEHEWDEDTDLKSGQIIEILVPKCKGIFLVAQLLIDEVMRAESRSQCEYIMDHLPKSVDEAYTLGLQRLDAQYSREKSEADLPSMAIQTLFWVAFSKNPMTGDQLRQALAMSDGNVAFDTKPWAWRGGGIDTTTGRLVVIDPSNEEVIIAHKSLTDYLIKDTTLSVWFPTIREHIPKTLLQFLLLDVMKGDSPSSGSTTANQEFLECYPLLPYALNNWGEGLDEILDQSVSLWELSKQLLETPFSVWNDTVRAQVVQTFVKKTGMKTELNDFLTLEFFSPGSIDGLYWVVAFDLRTIVSDHIFPDSECLVRDPTPTTPLGLAAALHKADMAKLLLKYGAKADLGRTTKDIVKLPLLDAVWRNDVAVTKMLLQQGADMTWRRGENDISPLDVTYMLGRGEVAEVLASHVSGRGGTKAQELQFLVRGGFVDHLRRAITEGLDVNHPCENGKTGLDIAQEMGHQGVIDVLIQNAALSNLRWPAERTNVPCAYPLNMPDVWNDPLVSVEKSFTEMDSDNADTYQRHPQNDLVLEIPILTNSSVRAIIFETVSSDQGWSDFDRWHGTYIGSNHSRLDVAIQYHAGASQHFVLQENIHASPIQRLHTNVWNLSELESSSPARAALIRGIRHPAVVQIFARAWGSGWRNHVSFVRVRMYDREIQMQAL